MQMIIYFWRKSKKHYKEWGIMTFVLMVELYMYFVWSQILVKNHTTLQILVQKNLIQEDIVARNGPNVENVQMKQSAFVASKKGKYYYPSNCSKANSLSIANMLYYKNKTSAEAAGYLPYSGCK